VSFQVSTLNVNPKTVIGQENKRLQLAAMLFSSAHHESTKNDRRYTKYLEQLAKTYPKKFLLLKNDRMDSDKTTLPFVYRSVISTHENTSQ